MSDILSLMKQADAIITDSHIVGTSGKHMSVYINKDALYPHTEMASDVGRMMAEKYKDAGVEVVVGPMLGGIILSQWTAYHLTKMTGKEVLSVYTEKDAEGNQIFSRRRYDRFVKGKKTLVVEDITNTGGSAKKVVETVKAAGGIIVALCVMVNRDPKNITSETMGAPFDALGIIEAEAYDESTCPLCKKGVPINTEVGHGKAYLAKKNERS
ncbi:MAG TPA: phosphoribosyltransferase family protein [Candidatus Peribacterales bacterium]|nr:phosphoribosyltransferase family protein [Candidatus Peribacterales bacterium]